MFPCDIKVQLDTLKPKVALTPFWVPDNVLLTFQSHSIVPHWKSLPISSTLQCTGAIAAYTLQCQSEYLRPSDHCCMMTSSCGSSDGHCIGGAGARGWAVPVLSLLKVGPRPRILLSHQLAVTQDTWHWNVTINFEIVGQVTILWGMRRITVTIYFRR